MPLVRVSSWPPNSRCARIIVKHDLRRSSHTLQALGILFCMRSVWILRARIDPFKPIIPLLNPRYSRGFIYRRNSDFIFVSLHLAKILSLRSKSISIVLPSFPWNGFLFQSKTLQPSCCTISTISLQCISCNSLCDAKWYSTPNFQLLRAEKLHLRNPKHSDHCPSSSRDCTSTVSCRANSTLWTDAHWGSCRSAEAKKRVVKRQCRCSRDGVRNRETAWFRKESR